MEWSYGVRAQRCPNVEDGKTIAHPDNGPGCRDHQLKLKRGIPLDSLANPNYAAGPSALMPAPYILPARLSRSGVADLIIVDFGGLSKADRRVDAIRCWVVEICGSGLLAADGTPEAQGAHIYLKALDGSDEVGTWISLA
jgi:hypothetical protein